MNLGNTIPRVLGYWSPITQAAKAQCIRPSILAALVAQESGGETLAERHEPGYRWLFGDDAHERPHIQKPAAMSRETFFAAQKYSRGLCQVMVATAYWMGFDGWPAELNRPRVGLYWGARYLSWCLGRSGGDVELALQRYNGGGNPYYAVNVMSIEGLILSALNEAARKGRQHAE